MIYLDTSAIAPFYWSEALSNKVEELLRKETQRGLSQLVEVELFSALSRKVRMREISIEEAKLIASNFQNHLEIGFYHKINLDLVHYQLARYWISQFTTPLRTLDALHLACASYRSIRLVTADEALAASAKVLGIEVNLIQLTS